MVTTICCMTHTHLSHYSLQHQMVSAAPDLNKAVKELVSENMPAMVNKVLQNEPGNQTAITLCGSYLILLYIVVKLLHLTFHGSKFSLRVMSNTGKPTATLDTLPVTRSGAAYSPKRMMYYAPRYRDHHKSNLAIVAFNMEKIFPCLAGKGVLPMCRMYTAEEDGFMKGRSIIEAADIGNNLKMFNKPVYAFAVRGCRKLTSQSCMPNWWQKTITCLLPRMYCSS